MLMVTSPAYALGCGGLNVTLKMAARDEVAAGNVGMLLVENASPPRVTRATITAGASLGSPLPGVAIWKLEWLPAN